MSWTDEDRRAKAWGGGSAGDEYVPLVAAIDEEARNQAQQAKSEAEAAMAAPYQPFTSRAQAEVTVIDGSVQQINVAGLAYVRDENGTALTTADGGSWSPLGEVTVEHFGARGDLTYTLEPSGYVRTGGSNDLAAFVAADEWAASSGGGVVHARGRYFIDSFAEDFEFRPSASWSGTVTHTPVIWVRYGVLQRGIVLSNSRVEFSGFTLIGQYDRAGVSKPTNNGHLGSIIGCGDYYTTNEHQLVTGLSIDVLMCRAANVSGQSSSASIMCAIMGYTEDSKVRLGLHGRTNVVSNMVILKHWGCQYDPASTGPDGNWTDAQVDKTPATIIQSYHPVGIDLTFSTEIDNANGHGLQRVWEWASVGRCSVGKVVSRNLRGMYWEGVGDVCDAFTVDRQRDQIGRNNRIAYQTAYDLAPEPGDYIVYYKGKGESKFEYYANSTVLVDRQMPFDSVCEGLSIELASGQALTQRIVYINGQLGLIDLGQCRILSGISRAIEREHSSGVFRCNLVESDGVVRDEFSRGGEWRIATNRGYNKGTTGDYGDSGWDSDNAVFHGFGDRDGLTTTLAAAAAEGATTIRVNPLSSDIYADTPIRIGGFTVYAKSTLAIGAEWLDVTPILAATASGAAVVVDRTTKITSLAVASESSEFGVVLNGVDCECLDLTELRWSGRYAAELSETNATLRGTLPASVGRVTASSIYTVRLDQFSTVTGIGVSVPELSPRVAAHFQLASGAPFRAHLTLVGGRIASATGLVAATYPTDQTTLIGCVDPNGMLITLP